MPYLYTRYLREGAGACRSCRAKQWEPARLPEEEMPDSGPQAGSMEEMPNSGPQPGPMQQPPQQSPSDSAEQPPHSPLPERLPWSRMRELTGSARQERPQEDFVPLGVQDQEYFRNLYPLRIRRMKDYIREELDRLEGATGMIYDEFPDRVRMDQIRDRVMMRMRADSVEEVLGNESYSQDVVESLLYQEIMERRSRRHS